MKTKKEKTIVTQEQEEKKIGKLSGTAYPRAIYKLRKKIENMEKNT